MSEELVPIEELQYNSMFAVRFAGGMELQIPLNQTKEELLALYEDAVTKRNGHVLLDDLSVKGTHISMNLNNPQIIQVIMKEHAAQTAREKVAYGH